jgi:hypothetical protein
MPVSLGPDPRLLLILAVHKAHHPPLPSPQPAQRCGKGLSSHVCPVVACLVPLV